jgi:hypothetical protein
MRTRRQVFRIAIPVLLLAIVAFGTSGCTTSVTTEVGASTPRPKSKVYPVPVGCPSPKDVGNAWDGHGDLYTAVDLKLLDSQLPEALPDGGCPYITSGVKTAGNGTATYEDLQAWYFNLGKPGMATSSELTSWAKAAGGKHSDDSDAFDLPTAFSGWTNSAEDQAGGESSSWGWNTKVIPAYTQGASGRIAFALDSAKVEALAKATTGGPAATDPTKALASGLAAAFTNSFEIKDGQGYTAQIQVTGSMEPFTSDVTNAPPGQFDAIASPSVGGSVLNTTTGRNTQTTGMVLVALYALKSAACTGYNGVSVQGADWEVSSYCAVEVGALSSESLVPAQSQTIPSTATSLKLGNFPQNGPALAQLNAPVSFYAYFGGTSGLVNPDWSSSQGCVSQTSSWGGQWFVPMTGWPDVICK